MWKTKHGPVQQVVQVQPPHECPPKLVCRAYPDPISSPQGESLCLLPRMERSGDAVMSDGSQDGDWSRELEMESEMEPPQEGCEPEGVSPANGRGAEGGVAGAAEGRMRGGGDAAGGGSAVVGCRLAGAAGGRTSVRGEAVRRCAAGDRRAAHQAWETGRR